MSNPEESVEHYEELFDKKYLRWFHLKGSPALVEILKAVPKVPMTLPNGVEEKNPVLHLKLIQGRITEMKPFVLNATNADSIMKIYGKRVPDWIGKQIVLILDKTQMYDHDKKKKVMVDCIRVRAPAKRNDEAK